MVAKSAMGQSAARFGDTVAAGNRFAKPSLRRKNEAVSTLDDFGLNLGRIVLRSTVHQPRSAVSAAAVHRRRNSNRRMSAPWPPMTRSDCDSRTPRVGLHCSCNRKMTVIGTLGGWVRFTSIAVT